MTEAHADPWPHPQGPWTVDDWMTLPEDGKRYEIIDGSLLVSPPLFPGTRSSRVVWSATSAMRHLRASMRWKRWACD